MSPEATNPAPESELIALEIPADLAECVEAGDKDFDWSAYIIGLIKEVTA